MKPAPAIVPPRRWPSGGKAKSKRTAEIEAAQRKAQLERERSEIGVAMNNPERRSFGDQARQPLTGYALGRLMLTGRIDPDLHGAGLAYEGIFRCHSAMTGLTRIDGGASIGALMVAAGISVTAEPDEEAVMQIRRKWSNIRREIEWTADRAITVGMMESALRAICIDGAHEDAVSLPSLIRGLMAVNRAVG